MIECLTDYQEKGETLIFDSHGIPELSFSFRTDLLGCIRHRRILVQQSDLLLLWTLVRKEANSKRYENTRIFLYDIPDPNPAYIQNYKFLSALFIMSSTVRFFSSLTILSRIFETALLANPSITNADNASSRLVLSVKANISLLPPVCQACLSGQQ